jgi:hypothetical protein
MIFWGFSFREFSPHLGFNIMMPEIAKRLLRSTVRLVSRWTTTIFPSTIRTVGYAMSASPLSWTYFLCDRALGPWAQFLGVFTISHFGRKRRCSCETSDLRNHEIGISHFGVSGYGCTCRREPRTPDSRSSKVVDVRSTTLYSSQSDDPDNFMTLRFVSHQDSTFFLSRLTKSQKVDPTVQLFPLINGCDIFMISRFRSL